MVKLDEETYIALHADKSVPIEQVVNVMNIAKRNNVKMILATAPEE
jgi:biopolymer transport protein ExbD